MLLNLRLSRRARSKRLKIQSKLWLIAGLGNPGSRYLRTRHNVGFEFIDRLSNRESILLRESDQFMRGKGLIGGNEVILLKPLTFMNRSGIAVKNTLHKYYIPIENLMVIHDDLDIETGLIKLRKNGSSGGHKGIESIINETGSREFIRIKVGIGRQVGVPSDQYVLGRFRPEEMQLIEDALNAADAALRDILAVGIESAMNKHNRKNKPMVNTAEKAKEAEGLI